MYDHGEHMFKIQTLNAISEEGLNQFPRDRYHLATDHENPHAILVRSYNLNDANIPASVIAVGRAGAGVNNIPVAQLTQRGIPVFNTPGANANAVRELVIAGMLIASRNICNAWRYVIDLEKQSEHLEKDIEQHKKQFVGNELLGKTLGVIGLGSVGVKVANAAIHLGMDVIGLDPTISVNRAWELSANVKQAHNIDSLLTQSDFISIHVPLSPETKHMINQDRLHHMKKNAVLLNFARDEIVDTQAILQALNEDKIANYVTDFPCAILKNHPRAISLPHLGASTKEAEENCAVMLAKQMREFLEVGSITNSINFPSIDIPHTHDVRIAIVNANIPNMVAQISSKLATHKINITSLINKSRDEIAYTVIDVNADVSESLLKEMSSIQGVIQVRKLVR